MIDDRHVTHSFINLCLQELRRDRTKPPRFLRRQSLTNGVKNERLRKRNSLISNHRNFYPVKVLYQYNPVHPDELALKPNDIIHVIRLVSSRVVDGETIDRL